MLMQPSPVESRSATARTQKYRKNLAGLSIWFFLPVLAIPPGKAVFCTIASGDQDLLEKLRGSSCGRSTHPVPAEIAVGLELTAL